MIEVKSRRSLAGAPAAISTSSALYRHWDDIALLCGNDFHA
jgi:hypothetical protein